MRKAIFAGGVIAVLVAVMVISQTRTAAQNQNRLAIQGDVLSLIGPGSSIGITVRDSETGVVVQSVRADTPASRAGVKEGDVVTQFDGERARSAAQVTRLVRETAPDEWSK